MDASCSRSSKSYRFYESWTRRKREALAEPIAAWNRKELAVHEQLSH